MYALGFTPPTIVLILSTFAITLLGLHGTLLWWLVFIAVSAWIFVIIVQSVKVEQELNYARASAVAFIAIIPAIAVALTYIR